MNAATSEKSTAPPTAYVASMAGSRRKPAMARSAAAGASDWRAKRRARGSASRTIVPPTRFIAPSTTKAACQLARSATSALT